MSAPPADDGVLVPAIARFSKLGEMGAVWLAIGLGGAAADAPRRAQWLGAAGRVALAYGVNQAIKVVVRRRRPPGALAPTLSDLSFPSAHATTSFCGAESYGRLGLRLRPLAFALAASRLALRVHHPSDVLAGALLGTVIGRWR
ncbi:MAG TPA: phosphatase PAP2 family protein [Solirubrobacteraceae bacterium]|nr:phosphatase PAP2 family protein [Solirubrobacteraceae bacterium]